MSDKKLFIPQQKFLSSVMNDLHLSPEDFALRLGCAKQTLDKWLLPCSAKEHKEMGDSVWDLAREIRRNN